MEDDEEVMRKALAAYFRSGATEQPSTIDSGVEIVEGLRYAVLRNVRGVLRVYRVRNDGMLKGLKRWPAAIDEGTAPRQKDVDSSSIIDPFARVRELHALDRPLSAAEEREVQKIFATVQEGLRQTRQLLRKVRGAIREAKAQERADRTTKQ